MDDLFEKIKDSATKIYNGAEKFANSAVSATKDMVDKTKNNFVISGIEKKVDDVLVELGEILYSEYLDGAEFSDDIIEKCKKIDKFKEEIDEIKSKMPDTEDNENKIVCPNCGEAIAENSAFCSKCGFKMEEE